MGKRNYNVFFHTHTISGIVISVALYIIFFAGAFALVKDEVTAWEKGEQVTQKSVYEVDYDRVIDTIEARGYNLYGRDIRMIMPDAKQQINVLLGTSQDTTVVNSPDRKTYFNIDVNTYEFSEYYGFYSFGELLYRLHFFSQIPIFGIYIAGFVAFFFLFAIVTGVIVHWKKIVKNFYVFRPRAKLKTVWTDAHTALGMIGLPFQFVFAVTSCFLCLSTLVLLPASYLYKNDTKKLMNELRPMDKTYVLEGKADAISSLNPLMAHAKAKWDHFVPSQVSIKNFGGSTMKFQVDGLVEMPKKFLASARVIYDVKSGRLLSEKEPMESNYIESVELTVRKLHFGDYGGMPLKIIYFILALITCFVIISGVLIWLEARNKKNLSAAKKLYNRKVGHIYLAICLGMYPITAFTFIVSKLLPRDFDAARETILFNVFFWGWILISVLFRFLRDNYKINKYALLSGTVFAFLIPLVNGLSSGNWFWKMVAQGQYAILTIDLLWIALGAISLWIFLKLKRPVPKVEHLEIKQKAIEEYREKHPQKTNEHQTQKFMRTKISILWLFLAAGFIVHHIYGLFSVYYKESVMIEGTDGSVPWDHHLWRIILEGLALLFCLLTLEFSKQWFKWIAFVWAILVGVFNVYHFLASLFYEASNVSELLILAMMVLANVFLAIAIHKWIKERDIVKT